MRCFVRVAFGLLTVLVIDTGHANAGSMPTDCGSNYIIDSNNQVSIDYKQVNFDYRETLANGRLFDTESGWVPGYGVSFSFMSNCRQNWLVDKLYLKAEFSRYDGETDYVGGSAAGGGLDFGSIRQKNAAIVTDYDFRIGKGFGVRRDLVLTPFLGVGHHEWDRRVNAGEDYKHAYYGLGILLQYSPVDRLVLSADALLGRTFDANIFITGVPGLGGFPDTKLDLGSSSLYKVGISGDYAFTRNLHMNAGVEWFGFDYGASAVANGISEPDSQTRNVSVRVGVGYAFGGSRDDAPLK